VGGFISLQSLEIGRFLWYHFSMKTLEKTSLFWDVATPDPRIESDFIIGRILDFGDTEDFAWAVDFYGKEKIKEVLRSDPRLGRKSSSFWCRRLGVDPAQLQCIKRQSVGQPSAFLQR